MKLLILASVLSVGLCMPGGWTKQDAGDQQYMAMLTKLDSKGLISVMNMNGMSPKLIGVQTQVVAGMNYNFTLSYGDQKTCYIVYFEQAWTNTHKITENTCQNLKRALAGGYQTQNANDAKWSQMLSKLAGMNLITMPSDNSMQLVGVRTQVVAGMNYEFTFNVNGKECKIVYYEVSWENKHEITSNTCNDLLHRRQLVGGWSKVNDVSDTGVQSCLGAALDMVNARSNSMYRLTDSNIISMEQQVVAGIKYRFKVEVAMSSCTNGGTKLGLTSVGCPANTNAQSMGIWDGVCVYAPWKSPGTEILSLNMGATDVQAPKENANAKPNLLGSDMHDLVQHGKQIIGGDSTDFVQHGKQLLGGDTTDFVQHGKQLLGNLLGSDGHDLKVHAKELLGSGMHDLVNHGEKLLGSDTTDFVKHATRNLIGQDGHDYKPHGTKHLIGQDGHDMQTHGNRTSDGKDCDAAMFEEFKKTHNKLYGSLKEEELRRKIFCDNMRRAKKFQQVEKGSARFGATKFADLSRTEFKKYVGKKWDLSKLNGMKPAEIPQGPMPESFDWREHGVVTGVKNQGSCGSCWAFSTTGNIEGQWAIKKKQLISLSEQELVDCDKIDEGCNGGLPTNAYKEIERLGGLETEKEYSYKGADEKCHFIKKDVRVYINSSVSISSNETEMAMWLAANGPISIGINAFAMQFYMGGISHPWSIFCSPSELDHGVLIVGYGVQNKEPYWIVKNSWGPDWGEKGYYLVYRGAGVCGLNKMCTSSVVD